MTIEELKKVPFRETCQMAMEGEYPTTYMSKDGRLGFCDHTCQVTGTWHTGTWHTSMPRVPVPRQITIEKIRNYDRSN